MTHDCNFYGLPLLDPELRLGLEEPPLLPELGEKPEPDDLEGALYPLEGLLLGVTLREGLGVLLCGCEFLLGVTLLDGAG